MQTAEIALAHHKRKEKEPQGQVSFDSEQTSGHIEREKITENWAGQGKRLKKRNPPGCMNGQGYL